MATRAILRTNLLTRSQDFGDAAWVAFKASGTDPVKVGGGYSDPDGGLNAYRVTLQSGARNGFYQRFGLIPCNGQVTASVWARTTAGTMTLGLSRYEERQFDPDSPATYNTQSGVQNVGTSWTRISYTFQGVSGDWANIAIDNGVDGDGGTIELYGAQLEFSATPSANITTTTAPVTVATPDAGGPALRIVVLGDSNDTGFNPVVGAGADPWEGMTLDVGGYELINLSDNGRALSDLVNTTVGEGHRNDWPDWYSDGHGDVALLALRCSINDFAGGSATADRVTWNAVASGVYQRPARTGQHTFSFYARLISGNGALTINWYNGSTSTALGTVTATSAWQRFSGTCTLTGATFENVAVQKISGQAMGVVELACFQLNTGATAAAYEATTSSVGTTNKLIYSEDLSNAAWFKNGTTPVSLSYNTSLPPVDTVAATAYANATTVIEAWQALGGRVLIFTPWPRTNAWWIADPVYEMRRQAYIALVVANAAGADAVVQAHAYAPLSDPDDTGDYIDKLHLTSAGRTIARDNVYAPAINALLASLGVGRPRTWGAVCG